MSRNHNDLPTIPENLAALVDVASSLASGNPENIRNFTHAVNDLVIDNESTPGADFCDILDRVLSDEQGFLKRIFITWHQF